MLVIFEMRTPAHMELMRQQVELFSNMWAKIEVDRHPDAPEAGTTPRLTLPFDQNKHILFAQSMQHWEQIVELHHRRNWSLWVSPDVDFVIADYPVSRCFARPPNHPFDSPAPATPNTLFMLPLGRGLMMAGDDKLRGATRLAPPRLAAYHNSLSLANAERFIYTFRDSFPVLWWEGSGYALQVIRGEQSVIISVDRREFTRLAQLGELKKPTRWGVHCEGELADLVPPEHRIPTDDLARDAQRNSS